MRAASGVMLWPGCHRIGGACMQVKPTLVAHMTAWGCSATACPQAVATSDTSYHWIATQPPQPLTPIATAQARAQGRREGKKSMHARAPTTGTATTATTDASVLNRLTSTSTRPASIQRALPCTVVGVVLSLCAMQSTTVFCHAICPPLGDLELAGGGGRGFGYFCRSLCKVCAEAGSWSCTRFWHNVIQSDQKDLSYTKVRC